jgi:hypothetical protein
MPGPPEQTAGGMNPEARAQFSGEPKVLKDPDKPKRKGGKDKGRRK